MTLAIEDAAWPRTKSVILRCMELRHCSTTGLKPSRQKLCFGARAYDIPMSSMKSMIGHPQGASGAGRRG